MDMSQVIQPKSDQINADDLIAGPMTIRISDVQITPGTEQPVSIRIDGDKRVFRPCKSMSRVLVAAWGADAKAYIGRSLTLYRDPKVKWGGIEVGGIRISHMTDIPRDLTMMLTESKANRKPFKVQVMAAPQPASTQAAMTAQAAAGLAKAAAQIGAEHFRKWFNSEEGKAARATGALADIMSDLKAIADAADAKAVDGDPWGLPGDGPTPEEMARAQAEAEAAARDLIRSENGND